MSLTIDSPYCIIDIETTGLNQDTDKIIEIFVKKIQLDGTEETFYAKIDPEIPISEEAYAVHQISDDMVSGSRKFKDISQELHDFIFGFNLVGYNASFIIKFLIKEFNDAGITYNYKKSKIIDVQKMWFKNYQPNSLAFAYQYLTGEAMSNNHRAIADADAVQAVLNAQEKLYEDFSFEAVSKDTNGSNVDLSGNIVIEDNQYVFNYGSEKKFRGKPVYEMFKRDMDYYSWIMRESNLPLDSKLVLKILYNHYLKKGNKK